MQSHVKEPVFCISQPQNCTGQHKSTLSIEIKDCIKWNLGRTILNIKKISKMFLISTIYKGFDFIFH